METQFKEHSKRGEICEQKASHLLSHDFKQFLRGFTSNQKVIA